MFKKTNIKNMNTAQALEILDGAVEKVEWINRYGIWSLSITPKLTIFGFFANKKSKKEVFTALKIVYQNDWQWAKYNIEGMQKQFDCHYYFARQFKTPWNLEPTNTQPGFMCN